MKHYSKAEQDYMLLCQILLAEQAWLYTFVYN